MPLEKRKIWALVMNSAHARIVRSLGWTSDPADPASPPDELEFATENRSMSDVMADKPGRSFASFGGGRRSAMEYNSDPLAEETRGMIRDIITALEHHQRKGDFKELAIFAEPQVLGELRKMLPGPLRDTVSREETANYLQLSPQELGKKLNAQLGLVSGGLR
ncbi:MAG: host attachment protein [Pararhodobacter sp.]|nr:host attachment protein [Pararhodobacter sp.]